MELTVHACIRRVVEHLCVARWELVLLHTKWQFLYGVQPNTFAINSLLSAICREHNQTGKAAKFFEGIKNKIPPDADIFAILLEGWEKEGNVAKAKTTFGEMVIHVGWSSQYMPAYDVLLNTLVRGSLADETIKFLQDIMVGSGLVPNLHFYDSMIGLLCDNCDFDNAFRLFDDMVYHGAFADSNTYNMIFECLIIQKQVAKAGKFFTEMIKNECPPTSSNCAKAIAMLFNGDDPEAALEIWNYMVDYTMELKTYAYTMLDNRIKIYKSTMEKLEHAFSKDVVIKAQKVTQPVPENPKGDFTVVLEDKDHLHNRPISLRKLHFFNCYGNSCEDSVTCNNPKVCECIDTRCLYDGE